MNKVSLHCQLQEYSRDDEIQESLQIGDLVSNNPIVAFAAEGSSINTVWLVYIIGKRCIDHSSSNTDDYGHNVPKSQPYLLCNYLQSITKYLRLAIDFM